jgi:nitrogen fixation protein NifB
VAKAKAKVNSGSADRAAGPASPKVLVAVASKGGGLVNQHFGHAKEFMISEDDAGTVAFVGHRKVAEYCQGGYGEDAMLENIIRTVADCKAVLASKVGPCPAKQLKAAGLTVVEAYDVIETVARQFYDEHVLRPSSAIAP